MKRALPSYRLALAPAVCPFSNIRVSGVERENEECIPFVPTRFSASALALVVCPFSNMRSLTCKKSQVYSKFFIFKEKNV